MDKKKVIEKIKELFSSDEENKEVAFVDVKTDDGKILRVADIAVDQSVMEITEDGEIEVADATYTLEDGTALVVVGGVITEVVEAEEEMVEEEPVEEEMAEESAPTDKDFNEALLKGLQSLTDEVKSLKEGFELVKKENENLSEKIEEFGKVASDIHTETELKFKKESKKEFKSTLHSSLGY